MSQPEAQPNAPARQALLVSCERVTRAQAQGAHCELRGGSRTSCDWDDEGQQLVCEDAGANLDAQDLRVVAGDGSLLCTAGTCTTAVRRRVATGSLAVAAPPEAGGGSSEVDPAAEADEAAATPSGAVMHGLSWVERLLTLWILLAMVVGVLLGNFTGISSALETATVGGVSLPIAVGLWLMMWPVLAKVRYELLGGMFRQRAMWGQLGMSAALNWLVGPALMTGLAWAALPDMPGYRNGVIMVGLARCIAMVLIWNQLAHGSAEYCAVLVAVNSVLQVLLYAPLALFYLTLISRQSGEYAAPFWLVARSALIFLGIPLAAALATRYALLAAKGRRWYDRVFCPLVAPVSLLSLLYTIIVLYALQGARVVAQLGTIARVAVPLLVYFALMWAAALAAARCLRWPYDLAVTQAFTAASNNFELAIAVAVGTFGVDSQEALAATVGPLVEVPVLLALVYVALWLRSRLAWPSGAGIVGL
ncbi:hypothetical protein COHA_004701 [Chlorella ohadii]|uniref:Arsenite transporter n=1 Tax=Chlorella ohadii TaxID=2649997 RepID=A0AAD5DT22_9CHLO|nr:hypothetical protein COHA_004701 [Chlorella ohadii]